MTREEAINRFQRMKKILAIPNSEAEKTAEAIDMAIEALQREEAEANGYCHRIKPKEDFKVVVRCKDCRHRYMDGDVTHYYWCRINERPVDDTDYCAWGERREDGEA